MTQFVIPNADPIATLTFEDVVTVDISSFTNAGDYISVSLPEFPRTKITVTESYIDFTSNVKGNFDAGPTDSIKFSEASPALPATAGDTEMRIPISLLKTINKAELSGVRFRIKASEECTFRCLSIRACAESWKYAPIDLDTLWNRVHRPPSTNGSVAQQTAFANGFVGAAKRLQALYILAPETITSPFENEGSEVTPKPVLNGGATRSATQVSPGLSTVATESAKWLSTEWKTTATTGPFPVGKDRTFVIAVQFTSTGSTQGIWGATGTTTHTSLGLTSTGVPFFQLGNSSAGEGKNLATALTINTPYILTLVWNSTAKTARLYINGVAQTPTAAYTLTQNDVNQILTIGVEGGQYLTGNTLPFAVFPYALGQSEITYLQGSAEDTWPAIFRSAETFGITDPEPVNVEVAAVINAGSFGVAKEGKFNKFGMIFRDYPEDDQTQVEVNSFNQAQLDGKGKQPDFGRALYDARDQADVDMESQSELDASTQFAIERKRDESEHSWIEVLLEWNATTANNKLHIWDADEVGYTYEAIPIEASEATELNKGKFALIVNLVNSTIQVKIYKVDQVGNIGTKLYDTGVLRDETIFKRRKGRFGWQAALQDGDAYIESVKTRGANYGEVISKEYQSNTPVKGVSLFAGSTEDAQLVEFFEPASPYTSIEPDPGASSTGKAIKVITTPGQSLQGIATNEFRIDDPENLEIDFNIKFPTTQIPGGGLSAFLFGEYQQIIPMHLTGFKRDTWSFVKVSVPAETLFQTGSYQLVLMQTLPVANAPWWIEDLSVKTSSVKWQARSYGQDAWSDPEERWQSVGRTLNEEQGGLVFEEPGNGLQVRAQTFRQDAQIHDFKAVPQYATLGRFIFEKSTAVHQGTATEVSKSPGSAAAEAPEGSLKKWLNPENIKANDSSYSTVSIGDNRTASLLAFNYGFTIPSNATITGIKIQVSRKGTYGASGGSFDYELYMLKNGVPVGNNFAVEGKWPTSVTTENYGGNGQLFGYLWTPEIINNSGTGVALRASGGKENTAEVNWIGMTVLYTLPA